MAKIIKWLFSFIGVVASFILGYFIDCILSGYKFTVCGALVFAAGAGIFGAVVMLLTWVHTNLISKNKIEWISYPDLKKISGWLGFSFWFIILMGAFITIDEYMGDNNKELSLKMVGLALLSIFSGWCYFSLLLGKRVAMFLLRSYLLSVISFLIMRFVSLCSKMNSLSISSITEETNCYYALIGFFILGLTIALCIKGLLLSFKSQNVKLYNYEMPSFYQIALVVLLWLTIVWCYNTDFKFYVIPHYPQINPIK